MGRQSRQSRRVKERRQRDTATSSRTNQSPRPKSGDASRTPTREASRGSALPIIALVAVAALAVGAFSFFALRPGQTPTPTPTPLTVPQIAQHNGPVDGIPCEREMLRYHVHSHL